MTDDRPAAPESFGLSLDAAGTYEATFVPRLFGEWASLVVGAAGIAPGQRVLDVACGTGVVAREVADRNDGGATIVGVDLNEAMLTVARRIRPEIEWMQGDVAALPFPDRSFDVVLCQAGLMFFPEPRAALGEMARVVSSGGTVVVQTWNRLEEQPAYVPFVEVASRHAGPDAVELLGTYFKLGDSEALRGLVEESGLEVLALETHATRMRFDSIDDFVTTEVDATPLVDRLDEDAYRRILTDLRDALAPFETGDGAALPMSGHVVTATKR